VYWWWTTPTWLKKPTTWPWLCSDLAVPSADVETQATSIGKTELLFQGHTHRSMTFLRKSGSLLVVSSKSCATSTQNSYCFCDRSHRTNFAATGFIPRSSIRISETVVLRVSSGSNSHTFNCRILLIATCTSSTFSGVLLVEGLPECRSLSTDFQPPLKLQYHNFIWASLIESSPKAFLIIQIVSVDKCPSLN
jgi:hypothetical protein